MRRPDQHARRSEDGFSLIELIIVMGIVAILVYALMMAMTSAKVTSRNESMKAAGASVDQAIGSFNRIYEPTPDEPDQFLSRGGGAPWSGNTTTPANGLADETNAWILEDWPDNPYSVGGVVVVRHATAAGCAAGQPGEVHACRTANLGLQTYLITAWGRTKDGAAIEVYRAQHGGR